MQKLILPLSLALLVLTGIATNASAAPNDSRVDVSRLAAEDARVYRGDQDNRDWHGGGPAAADLDRLNRELAQVRTAIGNSSSVSQRIRDRFHRAKKAADYLNDQFRRGNIRGPEVRGRAEEIRADLDKIRRELRGRHIGIGGW